MEIILILSFIIIFLIVLLVIEALIAVSGRTENFKNPERIVKKFGNSGKSLNYMIIGDSTGAGQGADYERGIAVQTARYLSHAYSVDMLNTSISGATVKDVLKNQLKLAKEYKPDLILISAGANDVLRFTLPWNLKSQLEDIVYQLLKVNSNMKIVLTASPDMGSPPRLPQPLRWIGGIMTLVVNKTFYSVIKKYNLTLAPIAEKTGPAFRQDHTLFAEDRFHPNEKGYDLWTIVLNKALDEAMTT